MASFVSDHPRPMAARLERRLRRQVTRRLIQEAQSVSRGGAAVTVLAPGPEDLAEIGANLMDPRRRLAVLETSLRTSRARADRSRGPTTSGWPSGAGLPAVHAGSAARRPGGRRGRRRRSAYAVTPALREWYVEGDAEELEYAAATAAARASLRLLADPEESSRAGSCSPRRSPDAEARPAPDLERAAVRLTAPVPLRLVDSALVDDPSAADDVRRAAAAVAAADAGDDDAAFVVDAVEDHELGWYAVQELSALVELEQDGGDATCAEERP